MIGSFLIFLREGIEGSMVVSIILTYLASAGRKDLFRWVFAGVGSALLLSAIVGAGLYALVKGTFIGSTAQTWFETVTFVVAVVILTSMTFWMKRNSRTLSATVKHDLGSALVMNSGFALATVAFVTVGREAIETAIFTLAIAFSTSPLNLLIGAVLGLAAALALSLGMYRAGIRLNFKRFFSVLGVLLLLVAAGLLADAVENLQALHVLPGGGQVLWHTGRWIAEDRGIGDILHGLLGYADSPTALQLGVWALFLVLALAVFLDAPNRWRAARSEPARQP